MVVQINVIALNLAATCLESALYGIFVVLTFIAVGLLIEHHGRASPSTLNLGRLAKLSGILISPLFLASLIIFATVTAHWIVAIQRLFDAFLYFLDGQAPMLYFSELGAKTEVAEIAQLEIAALTGDLIIIYRVWAVWNRDYKAIILPCLTTMGLVATGIGMTYQFSLEEVGADVHSFEVNRWVTSNTMFSLCTNIYSTCMIAFRLWRHSQNMGELPVGARNLMDVLIIIAESAAIYTVWTLFFFIAYQCKSLLHSLVISCWPAMSGISFMLILARVGWTRKRHSRQMATSAMTATGDTWAPARRNSLRDTESYPLGTVHLKASKTLDEGLHQTTSRSSSVPV